MFLEPCIIYDGRKSAPKVIVKQMEIRYIADKILEADNLKCYGGSKMKKTTARLLGTFLVLIMVLGIMPMAAFAADGKQEEIASESTTLAITETATGSLTGGYKADITVPTGEDGKPYQLYSISFTGTSFRTPEAPAGGSFSGSGTQYIASETATAKQVQADLSAIIYYGEGTVTISAVKQAPKEGDTYYNGHYYSLSKAAGEQTWQAAMTAMLAGDTQTYSGYKGHPVTVSSVGENNVVKKYYSNNNNIRIWLGGIANTATKDNSYTNNELNKIPGGDGTKTIVGKGNSYKWIWGTPEGDQTAEGYINAMPDGTDYWKSGEPNANPGYVVYFGCGGPVWDDLDKANVDPDGNSVFKTAYALTEYSPIDENGNWIYDENGSSAATELANMQSASQSFSAENVQTIYCVKSGADTATATGSKEKPYATIADAYAAATINNASIIYLLSDLTQDAAVAMNQNKNVTIASDPEELEAYNSTVGSEENQKTAFSISRTAQNTSTVFDVSKGMLTIENITLDGGKTENSGSAIKVRSNATVNIKDGATIKDFYVSESGTVYNNGGKLNMSGGLITGNKSGVHGGGVYNHRNSTFEMSGGSITGNSAARYGGGVCNCGSFTMSGGTIGGTEDEKNTAKSGGGVSNRSGGAFVMNGGSITGNSAADSEGKEGNGGGVENNNSSTFKMSGGSITGNSATNCGGGVLNYATLTVSGTPVITGNTKDGTANNVYLSKNNTIKVETDSTLSEGANIGVTSANVPKGGNKVTIAAGTSEKKYFSSDAGYEVNVLTIEEDNSVVLAEHSWSDKWTADDTHHWHACLNDGCEGTNDYTEHIYDQEVVSEEYLKSDATCTAKAVYFKSCICGKAGTETFENGELAEHTYGELIPQKDATCVETGMKAHYQCSVCEQYFDEEKAETTLEALTIAIDINNHDLEHHNAQFATCTQKGWKAYDTCKREGCNYTTYEEIPAQGHKLIKVPAVAATKTAKGNIEYWYCDVCGKYFSDKDGKVEITKADTVIEPINGDSGKKDDKTDTKPDTKIVPHTGDSSNPAFWIILMSICFGAVTVTTLANRKNQSH